MAYGMGLGNSHLAQAVQAMLAACGSKRLAGLTVACIVGAMLASATALALTPVDVTIFVDSKVVKTTARYGRVGDVLREAGVVVSQDDLVVPAPDEWVTHQRRIEVTRAFSVEVRADGRSTRCRTTPRKVKEILVDAGILLGPKDRVSCPLEETARPDMVIGITRIRESVESRRVPIPFTTERRPDVGADKGTVRVLVDGRAGLKEQQVLVTYEDGRAAGYRVLSETILERPIKRVIMVGTRNPLRTLTTSRGTFRYRDCYTMVATAYEAGPRSCGKSADGYTAIGVKARPGVVAVDPRVIPLKRRLYVEGYGPALAADTGRAIKGMRIDLFFETVRECLSYGRRKVKVYVLED